MVALLLLAIAGGLLLLRAAYADRVYPAVHVADQPLAGMTLDEARAALDRRAREIEASRVTFSYEDRRWTESLGNLGVDVDPAPALAAAFGVGREEDAWGRLRTTAGLVREDERIPLKLSLDRPALERWFDTIDQELGRPPQEAALAIDGTSVTVVPEADGVVVDRARAAGDIVANLRGLHALEEALPTIAKPATVRAADLTEARDRLAGALGQSVQVTFGEAYWTLAPADLARFVTQTVDPAKRGAAAFSVGLDHAKLTAWLDERLAGEINREPEDAIVGWNGERLVSIEESVDGAELEPERLAEEVEASFFGDHAPVPAPVTITKPTIDSGNLDELGVVTLLGTGNSNYSGSTDGRATNVEVGAARMNGTLVPPGGVFSFNGAIGAITEEAGFVEAQVISGERIGKDIGGGICQVSTTVFRAAYLAGFPMVEWWPHTYQIPFYEYDGWPPGLDASILQEGDDPANWGDFRFRNPSDGWLLVESWSNGAQVIVNIYGPDLGWQVTSDGPHYGQRLQVEPDLEIVDPELEPGTIDHTEAPLEGLEVSHFRTVYDRDGTVLEEQNFYTKYFPRGNVWRVSPDMKGQSPADPDRPLPKPSPPPVDEAAMDAAAEGEAPVAPAEEASYEEPVYEEPDYEEPDESW